MRGRRLRWVGETVSAMGACGKACAASPSDSDNPADDPVRQCGVCYLVAKLDVPPPFVVYLAVLEPVAEVEGLLSEPLCGRDVERRYLGRAPPFA